MESQYNTLNDDYITNYFYYDLMFQLALYAQGALTSRFTLKMFSDYNILNIGIVLDIELFYLSL